MSEKLEQIKKLQEDLFVEEHGITKEQARKLNEFIFREPTGSEFSFWNGKEVPSPPVSVRIDNLRCSDEFQGKKIEELERKYDRLSQLWVFSVIVLTAGIIMLILK